MADASNPTTSTSDDFFLSLAKARAAYATGGVQGASSQIKQMFDAWDHLIEAGYGGLVRHITE